MKWIKVLVDDYAVEKLQDMDGEPWWYTLSADFDDSDVTVDFDIYELYLENPQWGLPK